MQSQDTDAPRRLWVEATRSYVTFAELEDEIVRVVCCKVLTDAPSTRPMSDTELDEHVSRFLDGL